MPRALEAALEAALRSYCVRESVRTVANESLNGALLLAKSVQRASLPVSDFLLLASPQVTLKRTACQLLS